MDGSGNPRDEPALRTGPTLARKRPSVTCQPMDIFNLNSLLAQLLLALGAALVIGNLYALIQNRRGIKPKNMDGDLRRGRAWWLTTVGMVITVWAGASLLTL